MMEIQINKELCRGCGSCIPVCPTGAISLVDGIAEVNNSLCTLCQACVNACPAGAISIIAPPAQQDVNAVQVIPEQAAIIGESALHPPAHRHSFLLSSVGSVILPRLANLFMDAVERYFLQGQSKTLYRASQNTMSPTRANGRGYRRRVRGGGQWHQ